MIYRISGSVSVHYFTLARARTYSSFLFFFVTGIYACLEVSAYLLLFIILLPGYGFNLIIYIIAVKLHKLAIFSFLFLSDNYHVN